jgi:O-antigen biosynthesis rhamnosyltransferase
MKEARMKILHITSTFFPDTNGGIEQVINQIAHNTKKYNVQNKVLTLSDNDIPQNIFFEDLEVIRAKRNFTIASCGFSIKAFSLFKEYMKWADIIHYHFPWPFADLLSIFSGVQKKSVITYHSDIVRQKGLYEIYKPLMHKFINNVDKVVATSSIYAKSSPVLSKYENKLKVIPIGISENSYPDISAEVLNLTEKKVGSDFFLFIGMLRQYKGLKYLLNAIKGSDLKCVIAGTGVMEKELRLLAGELKLKNVFFLGRVTEEEKMALLKLCKAVIFSSHQRSEAFGVSLLEGAMNRKPLISTELDTGSSFINIHGKTGLIAPPKDSQSLRNAMYTISNNNAQANKMGLAARKRYEKLFTGDKMAESYFELYNELIS